MKRLSHVTLNLLLISCLLCGVLLSGGCSSIKVIETWNQPSWSKPPFKKPMILAIGYDENRIAIIEDIMVAEMGRAGVTAIAGHNLIPVIMNASRDQVVAAVRSSGADAVLSMRVISKGDRRVTQDGQSGAVYGTATNVGGSYLPSAKTYDQAGLQANLYDSATAELVWSATISTFDADREARVSRDLSKFFLEKLRKDGFL